MSIYMPMNGLDIGHSDVLEEKLLSIGVIV